MASFPKVEGNSNNNFTYLTGRSIFREIYLMINTCIAVRCSSGSEFVLNPCPVSGPYWGSPLSLYQAAEMQTMLIGHRNPDMDSICSAIAYAELKRKLGSPDVVAGRAGNTNERIDYVLQKFGVSAPDFVSDVAPTVADVMETQVISVPHDSSIYHAMNSIEKKQMRGLPVVDAENRCLGLLSGWKVSQYLIPQREETISTR